MGKSDQLFFIQQIYQTEERLFVIVDNAKLDTDLEENHNFSCIEFDRKSLLFLKCHKDICRVDVDACSTNPKGKQPVAFFDSQDKMRFVVDASPTCQNCKNTGRFETIRISDKSWLTLEEKVGTIT